MNFPLFTYFLYGVMWRVWFPTSTAWATRETPKQPDHSEGER